MFPISFGMVDKEDGPSWTWFLNQLRVCISTSNHFGNYTIMSDRQKVFSLTLYYSYAHNSAVIVISLLAYVLKQQGLLKAINEVFPQSPQRYCLRHIYANFQSVGFRVEESLQESATLPSATADGKGMDGGRQIPLPSAADGKR